MDKEITRLYGNKLRLRVCGLCWQSNNLLMVNHKKLTKGNFWAPPGGGAEFGTDATTSLIREFEEETGLRVEIDRFQFVCEFIKPPLHAVELFFQVLVKGGTVKTGMDPEHRNQIIEEVKFMSMDEIMALSRDERHGVFQLAPSAEKLKSLTGYWRI
jgi:8-oxo-dGTP diphosphatase